MSAAPKGKPASVVVVSYLFVERLIRRGYWFVGATFSGIGLGLFSEHTIARINQAFYDGRAGFRDDAYNMEGLHGWEKRAIDKYFGDCRRVLIAGAGGGREALAISKLGYIPTAFDCNAALVEYANAFLSRQGTDVKLLLAPPDHCPPLSGEFDAAIIGWGAYTHIMGCERRVAFLKEISRHLKKGGALLLSFWDRPIKSRRFKWTAGVANGLRFIRGRPSLELGDELEPCYTHSFVEDELALELKRAGFVMEFFSTHPYGHAVAIADRPFVGQSTA